MGQIYGRITNYAMPPHDRGLRDIVVARVHGEIQYWVLEKQLMAGLSSAADFCADLLSYTVKNGQERSRKV